MCMHVVHVSGHSLYVLPLYLDFFITLIHDPDRDDPAEEVDGSILDRHLVGDPLTIHVYTRIYIYMSSTLGADPLSTLCGL